MIFLASSSPSRKAILEAAGTTPVIVPAQVDEEAILSAQPQEDGQVLQPGLALLEVAEAKAQKGLAHVQENYEFGEFDLVVAADSMLLIDGHLQGKPYDPETMIERWRYQRGRKAQLLTGHCFISGAGHMWKEYTTSTITFANISEEDIKAYAYSEEALGCAGAFTLEAKGGWFIDHIDGDYTAILGLSLPVIRQALYSFGSNVNKLW
ncbi:MAG: nucleoside triphosphate pyrophosphatase [Corynebacterium sp.]|nr:nucleoside triphosphate pyrophosphatase [Corynebacterium sp.]